MTLSSTTNRMDYQGLGDGADRTWSYTFFISDASHLKVITTSTTGVETVESYDEGGVNGYNVSGVGSSSGGVVTFGTSNIPGVGESITILRVVPLTQTTDIRNQGDFFAETHEDEFDKLTMIDQQQQDAIDRSIILPRSTVIADFDPELPSTLVGEVSVALVTNATGDGWDVGPTTSAISGAQASAVAAAASATLASQWATLTSGLVAATDYSAKAWAIGGTGVTDTASRGAAKEWAIETASTVDGTDYSAKEWAKGTQVRGIASGGSSKDWANYTGGTVDNTEYSAKKYAQDSDTSATASAASAVTASAAATSVLAQNVLSKVFGDSPITLTSSDRGVVIGVDCTGGAVAITLPTIAALSLASPFSMVIKKTDSTSNAVTVTRGGTDTIDGATSVAFSSQYEGAYFFAEDSTSPDFWSIAKFGASTTVSATLSSNYNVIIGSAAQVTAGSATHSTFASWTQADGDRVLLLSGYATTENVTISKRVFLTGFGYESRVDGTITLTNASDQSHISNIRSTGNITLDSGADGIFIHNIFFAATKTFTDNGSGNLLTAIQL